MNDEEVRQTTLLYNEIHIEQLPFDYYATVLVAINHWLILNISVSLLVEYILMRHLIVKVVHIVFMLRGTLCIDVFNSYNHGKEICIFLSCKYYLIMSTRGELSSIGAYIYL